VISCHEIRIDWTFKVTHKASDLAKKSNEETRDKTDASTPTGDSSTKARGDTSKNNFSVGRLVMYVISSYFAAWVFGWTLWWTFMFAGGFVFDIFLGDGFEKITNWIVSFVSDGIGFYVVWAFFFVSTVMEDFGYVGPRKIAKKIWRKIEKVIDF